MATNEKITAFDIKKALSEKHDKDFFLTEVKSGSTWMSQHGEMKRLDGLAIRKSWTRTCFTGYEIKVSRSDFLRDAKFYTYEELCNELYIVCPKGMIRREELSEAVGLMYYDPEKKTIQTKKKAIFRKIDYSADMLLYIIFSRLDSDRLPFCSSREEYCQRYVQHELDNRELASSVKSRLIEENARLERELQSVNAESVQRKLQRLCKIERTLEKYDIWGFGTDEDVCKRIEERMNGIVSTKQIKYIKSFVEDALRLLNQLVGTDEQPQ